jgi:hypothetical protein
VSLRKIVPTGVAAVLGLAVVGIPAMALAEDSPGGPPPSVSQPGNLSATVSQSPSGVFSATLPGFGSLTFRVDPTTGTLTGLTVAADPGVTAGAPVLREEGVEVPFSGPATSERFEVEVESENGVPRVTAKAEGERNQDEANRDDRRDDHGDDNDADDTPVQPGAVDELHGDGDHGDHDANGDRDAPGDNGEPPATTTTTTFPSAPTSNRSPGGPPPQSDDQNRGPGSENSGSNSSTGSDNSGSDNSGQGGPGQGGPGQGGPGQGDPGQGGSDQSDSGSGRGGPGH